MRFSTTTHGTAGQNCDPERKTLPTSYYTETSPIADLFSQLSDSARIGVIGLGVGVCASLARQGQHMTFYEIDPVVIEIARDPRFFRFSPTQKPPVMWSKAMRLPPFLKHPLGISTCCFLTHFLAMKCPVKPNRPKPYDGSARVSLPKERSRFTSRPHSAAMITFRPSLQPLRDTLSRIAQGCLIRHHGIQI
jgi:hypothetical protein